MTPFDSHPQPNEEFVFQTGFPNDGQSDEVLNEVLNVSESVYGGSGLMREFLSLWTTFPTLAFLYPGLLVALRSSGNSLA